MEKYFIEIESWDIVEVIDIVYWSVTKNCYYLSGDYSLLFFPTTGHCLFQPNYFIDTKDLLKYMKRDDKKNFHRGFRTIKNKHIKASNVIQFWIEEW